MRTPEEEAEYRSADARFISIMESIDIGDRLNVAMTALKVQPHEKVRWDTCRFEYAPWKRTADYTETRYEARFMLNGHLSPAHKTDYLDRVYLSAKITGLRTLGLARCSIEAETRYTSHPLFQKLGELGDNFVGDGSRDENYISNTLAYEYRPSNQKQRDDYNLDEIFTKERIISQVDSILPFMGDKLEAYLSGKVLMSSDKRLIFYYWDPEGEDEEKGDDHDFIY